MIFEYALEPEFVVTLKNFKDYRFFIGKFGLGEPRIVSRYPKSWARYVWDSFSSDNDMDRKRMEELLIRLSEKMITRRNACWNQDLNWLENATNEHSRRPFQAIIARSNPENSQYIIVGDGLGEDNQLWKAPKGMVVRRKADQMAHVVKSMLSNSELVIFIDPHFNPLITQNRRFLRPLKEFLKIIKASCEAGCTKKIVLCTDAGLFNSTNKFQELCKDVMARNIPKEQCVCFRALKEKDGGPKLHNRYIITDIGGVKFGIGLDDDDDRDGETDDVDLLTSDQYIEHWNNYVSEKLGFEIIDEAIVIGEWEI